MSDLSQNRSDFEAWFVGLIKPMLMDPNAGFVLDAPSKRCEVASLARIGGKLRCELVTANLARAAQRGRGPPTLVSGERRRRQPLISQGWLGINRPAGARASPHQRRGNPLVGGHSMQKSRRAMTQDR
jgi:hypothetical protein